jgi:hypothetical protein
MERRALLHSLAFSILMVLPLVGLVLDVNDQEQLGERRRLADWPGVPRDGEEVAKFPERFERWFDDHFGFRSLLIRSNREIEWRVSRSQVGMVVGSESWLFLGAPSRIDRYRCVVMPHTAEWGELARERGTRFAQRSIPFFWTIAPDKHTIYPDHLPPEVVDATRPCDLDAATHVLRQPYIELVDLRGPLREERAETPLYYKTDTHWNMLGAARGAELLMQRVRAHFPAVPHFPLDDFEVLIEPDVEGGDIATMVRVYGETYTENLLTLKPRRPLQARPVEGSPALEPTVFSRPEQRLVMETGRSELPTAVLFHDSFGYGLMPYLSEHFERIVYLHTTGALDFSAVDAEDPDVVLLLHQEKKLAIAPEADPADPVFARASEPLED